MNLVCFRLRGDDAKSKALMDRLNDAGEMFLTHTVLPGPDRTPILTLRLAIAPSASPRATSAGRGTSSGPRSESA